MARLAPTVGGPEMRRLYISTSLELKAAYNGLRCFATDIHDCNVLLGIDNTTTLSYINKFGSSLISLISPDRFGAGAKTETSFYLPPIFHP